MKFLFWSFPEVSHSVKPSLILIPAANCHVTLKAFWKTVWRKMIARVTQGCPVPTWLCSTMERSLSTNELSCTALSHSKEKKPSPAFKFFSLCLKTKGNQGQKEKSRRLPEKKSYSISRNIFCINRKEKKSSSREYLCSVLISFHTTPGSWGWTMSRRKIPLQYNPISYPAPLAFFPMPWSLPAWQLIISSLDLHTENHPSHFTIIGWFAWENKFC